MKNSLLRKAILVTVMALGLLPLLIEGAEAADFLVTPSIRLGQGWDSNIFGTSDNVLSDFYATVTPTLAIATASQNLSMQLLAGVEGRWYYDNPEISSAVYSKFLRLTPIDNGWRPTARTSVSLAAYFLETRDPAARSFLIPVDPAVPPQEIATYGLQKSRDFGASIGLGYQAAPGVATAVTVYGAANQFPDQSGGGADSHTLGADASIRYVLSQRSSAGVYGSGSKEYFQESPDARTLGAGFLGGYQFSPAFRIDGRLGISFVRQPAMDTDNAEHTSNDPAGTVTLAYSDNTFMASLYGNVGYAGTGGTVTRMWTVGINLADHFSQRWSWSLGGNYQVSRTVFSAIPHEDKTVNGTGSIRYAPWEWGAFDLTGNATMEQTDVPNGDMNRYSVILGFTMVKSYSAF